MVPIDETESSGVVWIKGSVSTEVRDEELVRVPGVFVKTSQGAVVCTDERGEFTCPVCVEGQHYALCAFKLGFELWVGSRVLDRQAPDDQWEIFLSPCPEGAVTKLETMAMRPPGCIQPLVIDCATRQPISRAWVKLDSDPWQQVDTSGNGVCLCGESGPHVLKARKLPNYPMKTKNVNLPAGVTLIPGDPTNSNDPAVICLDHV
jgi:hypothetical protein